MVWNHLVLNHRDPGGAFMKNVCDIGLSISGKFQKKGGGLDGSSALYSDSVLVV